MLRFIPLEKWKRFVHIWKQVRTKQTTTVTGIFLYGILGGNAGMLLGWFTD